MERHTCRRLLNNPDGSGQPCAYNDSVCAYLTLLHVIGAWSKLSVRGPRSRRRTLHLQRRAFESLYRWDMPAQTS